MKLTLSNKISKLTLGITLFVLAISFFIPQVSLAATVIDSAGNTINTYTPTPTLSPTGSTFAPNRSVNLTLPDGTQVATVNPANVVSGENIEGGGQSGQAGTLLTGMWNFVAEILYIFFVVIPVTAASIAGYLLNESIRFFIVEMGDWINVKTGIGFAINNLWTVIRDVMNIGFIFGLVFIGIKTILNSEDSGTRRSLGLLIAAALLINFSLFATKAIIDFTNVMAVQIYNLLNASNAGYTGVLSYSGLTGAFFEATGAQSLITSANIADMAGKNLGQIGQYAALMFMVMILFYLIMIIFAAASFMLLARFVALVLYMIFSPIMFLGWVLPWFSSFSTNWWRGFFKRAFFAPAFLFMLYISLITVQQFKQGVVGNTADFAAALSLQSQGAFGIVMVYAFAMAMLIASIVVAQQMGIAGAATTMGALHGIKNWAYNNTVARTGRGLNNMRIGAQSWAYRNSMGRYYKNKLNKIDELENQIANGNAMERTAAKIRLARMKTLSGNSTTAAMRVDAEAGKNYGAGGASFADQDKYHKDKTARTNQAGKNQQLMDDIENGLKTNASSDDKIKMEKAIRDIDVKEFAKSKRGKAILEKIGDKLTPAQVKKLAEADVQDIPQTLKNKIFKKRQEGTHAKLGLAPNSLTGLNKANDDDLRSIDVDLLKAGAMYLQDAQIDDLKKMVKDGSLTDTELKQIKDKRESDINNTRGDVVAMRDVIKTRKSEKEIAKLPNEFLEDPNFATAVDYPNSGYAVTPKLLTKIATDSSANTLTIGANLPYNRGDGSPVGEWMRSGIGLQF